MELYNTGRMQGNAHGKRAPSEDVQGEDGSFRVGSPPPSPRAPGSPLTYRCSSPRAITLGCLTFSATTHSTQLITGWLWMKPATVAPPSCHACKLGYHIVVPCMISIPHVLNGKLRHSALGLGPSSDVICLPCSPQMAMDPMPMSESAPLVRDHAAEFHGIQGWPATPKLVPTVIVCEYLCICFAHKRVPGWHFLQGTTLFAAPDMQCHSQTCSRPAWQLCGRTLIQRVKTGKLIWVEAYLHSR